MRDPLWARYYAAVDRLIEVGAPVAAKGDDDVIVLPADELQAMKAAVTQIFAEVDAAVAAIEARDRASRRP